MPGERFPLRDHRLDSDALTLGASGAVERSGHVIDDEGMNSRALLFACAALMGGSLGVGCADGRTGPGEDDAGIDAFAVRSDAPMPSGADAGRDGGRDAGPTTCMTGTHLCGAACVPDMANMPANGCRLGCGTPCMTPANAMGTCDAMGRCGFTCTAPYVPMGMGCSCTPTSCMALGYECGAPDNGCGEALSCGTCSGGGTCVEGRCGCLPDAAEPNNSNTSARAGMRLNDSDDPSFTISGMNIHAAGNEDWFAYPVTDGSDGGNPRINVTLSNIPAGADYELVAYYACDTSNDDSSCSAGSPDNFVGRGCNGAASGSASETVEITTECANGVFNSDDSGTLYIRVIPRAWSTSCGAYQIDVRVT